MRVPVTDLVGRPGEARELRVDAAPAEFGDAPWGPTAANVQAPVRLDVHLESVVEGVLVRGAVGFTVEVPCARCLESQVVRHDVDVAELFVDPTRVPEDEEHEEGYELLDDATAIDLTTLVRDALVIDLPMRIVCRGDCQGLCPVCGTNRNATDCGHRPEAGRDPRWAKLQELELPE